MLSIAALVGLVTPFGIAARNGILLVARYRDLTAAYTLWWERGVAHQ